MGLYEIIKGFDEKALYRIAKSTGNKQLLDDVKYMRLPYRRGVTVYAERIDGIAFFTGYHNSDHFRLVGIGVNKEEQGKGFGKFMFGRAVQYARSQGYNMIKTRTNSGVDFYQKWGGGRIVGIKGNDYLMEIDI